MDFFKKVIDAVTGDDRQVGEEGDYYQQARPASEDPYGDPADYGPTVMSVLLAKTPTVTQAGMATMGNLGRFAPASEDPYGDPAGRLRCIRRCPSLLAKTPTVTQQMANYVQFGDVRPASEDPYGDPADQENYY
jgi:hypothetical protein